VRHIGCVFGLTPNEDAFDSLGLPYPDLSVTISQIRMEPAANMWEHFNTPGPEYDTADPSWFDPPSHSESKGLTCLPALLHNYAGGCIR
jgi:hypothetical protein